MRARATFPCVMGKPYFKGILAGELISFPSVSIRAHIFSVEATSKSIITITIIIIIIIARAKERYQKSGTPSGEAEGWQYWSVVNQQSPHDWVVGKLTAAQSGGVFTGAY